MNRYQASTSFEESQNNHLRRDAYCNDVSARKRSTVPHRGWVSYSVDTLSSLPALKSAIFSARKKVLYVDWSVSFLLTHTHTHIHAHTRARNIKFGKIASLAPQPCRWSSRLGTHSYHGTDTCAELPPVKQEIRLLPLASHFTAYSPPQDSIIGCYSHLLRIKRRYRTAPEI